MRLQIKGLYMPIKLIAGLRNPGSAYEKTRHNAGSWFVEALAKRYSATFKSDKKFHGESALIDINGIECRLFLPNMFMNQSGTPLKIICQFYKIPKDSILVVHDELDLPPGIVKLKTGGGHGGHNGLKDILRQFSGANFHRLRFGIGHPGHKELVHNHVLSKPSQTERLAIHDAIDRALGIINPLVAGNIAKAMTQLHT
jgi:peptidyl-tRNA hydrolase, PTH1 family